LSILLRSVTYCYIMLCDMDSAHTLQEIDMIRQLDAGKVASRLFDDCPCQPLAMPSIEHSSGWSPWECGV